MSGDANATKSFLNLEAKKGRVQVTKTQIIADTSPKRPKLLFAKDKDQVEC